MKPNLVTDRQFAESDADRQRGLLAKETMFDSLNGVDWDLLHRQKLILVEWLSGQPPKASQLEELWGIVHLLDALQDDAVDGGRWQFPEDHERKEGA